MPLKTIIRIISILLVVAISNWTTKTGFHSVFISIGLSHYLIGFIYSKKQFLQIIMQPKSFLAFLGLVLIGILITYFRCPSIVYYFGLHYALSEAYLMNLSTGNVQKKFTSPILSRFFLNFFIYNAMLFRGFVSTPIYVTGALLSCILFFYFLSQYKSYLKMPIYIDNVLFEITGLAMLICSLFFQFTFHQIILYHFISWIFIPQFDISTNKYRGTLSYFLITFLATGAFVLITPLGNLNLKIPINELLEQVTLWGYIHITASFAFSSFNPGWVIRWFRKL